jgi:hypothetical protein
MGVSLCHVLNPDFAANSAFIQYIVYGSCKNIDEAIKQYQEENAYNYSYDTGYYGY